VHCFCTLHCTVAPCFYSESMPEFRQRHVGQGHWAWRNRGQCRSENGAKVTLLQSDPDGHLRSSRRSATVSTFPPGLVRSLWASRRTFTAVFCRRLRTLVTISSGFPFAVTRSDCPGWRLWAKPGECRNFSIVSLFTKRRSRQIRGASRDCTTHHIRILISPSRHINQRGIGKT
jgi:hypothetical protein